MAATYSTILFDLDHTLLDSNTSEAAAFENALRNAGIDEPCVHFETYDRINQALWAAVERGELTPDDVQTRRFHDLIEAIQVDCDPIAIASDFVEGLARFGELYPGVAAVLDQLAERSTLALITNGLSFVQRSRIERLDLGRYFSAVAISAEIGGSKPGTLMFDKVFADLGNPPKSSSVIVGDSLSSDMQGGVNYDIDTIWYNPHRRTNERPELVTHEIHDLAALSSLTN